MFRAGYRRRQTAAWPVRAGFWVRMMADLVVTAAAEWAAPHRSVARSPEQASETGRMARGHGRGFFRWLPGAGSVRHGARRLAFAPARTAASAATLGLGIGATLVMLALVRGVLLRPLPFAEPGRLVRMLEVDDSGATWWPSYPNFADWREHGADLLAGVAAVDSPRIRPVLYGDRAARLAVGRASRGLFDLLGVPLARGREPDTAENAPGGTPAAVVSWSTWNDRLGAAPLDRTIITVGIETYQVVGVTPPGFRFLGAAGLWAEADVWLPLDREPGPGGRRSHGYHVVGRLNDDVDLATAGRRVNALAARMREVHGEATHAHTVRLTPLREVVVGDARQPLTMLTGAALLVLFVACFNLAGALLAAGIGRRDELAVRRALGASRRDVLAHVLVEALLLALPGALVGILVAWLGLRLLLVAPPVAVARIGTVSLDGPDMAMAVVMAVAAALVGGLGPAWTLSARDPADTLAAAGRSTSGRREGLVWHGFVAAQVALTVVLLTAAALLAGSLFEARSVDLGYDPDPVLAISVSLPESRYPAPADRVAFFERALAATRAVPGVVAVGVTNQLPHVTQAFIGGAARPAEPETWMFAGLRTVNDGFFDALGIPRLALEAGGAGTSVVVDESIAETLFDGDDPVGGTLASSLLGEPVRIGGLVGAVREWNHPLHAVGTLYVDYRRRPDLLLDAHLLVRTGIAPSSLAAPIRSVLAAIDPAVPVEAEALASLVGEQLADRRLILGIAAAFALVTLSLAAVGVYSVVAFTTHRRRREAGIRLALGARPNQVRRAMLGHGLRPALAGLVAGAGAAVPAGWMLRAQLFAVRPTDPFGLLAAVGLLGVVALLAAWLPTRATTRQDPLISLRQN